MQPERIGPDTGPVVVPAARMIALDNAFHEAAGVYMRGRPGEAGTTILTAVAAFLETATPLSTDLADDESQERVRFAEAPLSGIAVALLLTFGLAGFVVLVLAALGWLC
jgi:hypothetical protein